MYPSLYIQKNVALEEMNVVVGGGGGGGYLELCQGCKGLQRKLKKGIGKDVFGAKADPRREMGKVRQKLSA